MRFDEIGRRVREQPALIVAAAAVLSVVIVVAGLAIGLAGRGRAYERESMITGGELPGLEGEDTGLLLPDPLELPGDDGGYRFHIETSGPGLELLPVRASELMHNRSPGVEVDFKPFVFEGEELDVLMPADGLAEP